MIALDSLHEDFDTTTASLLEAGDKTIDQIQSILQSKEAKNISKRTTGAVGDLAMAFRDGKRKANSDDEYYNCHKLGHFGRDCSLSDKRLNRIKHPHRAGSRSALRRPTKATRDLIELIRLQRITTTLTPSFSHLDLLQPRSWSKNNNNCKGPAPPGSWTRVHPGTCAMIDDFSATRVPRALTL